MGAPFLLRREHDWSLSHRRLAQGPLPVMVVNLTQIGMVPDKKPQLVARTGANKGRPAAANGWPRRRCETPD